MSQRIGSKKTRIYILAFILGNEWPVMEKKEEGIKEIRFSYVQSFVRKNLFPRIWGLIWKVRVCRGRKSSGQGGANE